MIKLRLDEDYPYPSRTKSFLYIALGNKKEEVKIIWETLKSLPK